MMKKNTEFVLNQKKYAIGLMSGTSADGIDAALVEIQGSYLDMKVKLIDFISLPYEKTVQDRLLYIASGQSVGTQEICQLNFYLGHAFAQICLDLCNKNQIHTSEIAFVGSHGHTIYHQSVPQMYLGKTLISTLQIGEASLIADRLGCKVVSDFRVRDVAAGGLGAPLVPYTEFLLYRQSSKNIALQNIGGIGNITYLKANATLDEIVAFDTGPGNMIMDQIIYKLSNGKQTYDDRGELAGTGQVQPELLAYFLEDPYLDKKLPKTCGREEYGPDYIGRVFDFARQKKWEDVDILTTATAFTAQTIKIGIEKFCHGKVDELIVGGGGSLNPVLMKFISDCLPETKVLTQEDVGFDGQAKEAVAFAILANETLFGQYNNMPSVTGADKFCVMGKISQ